MHNHESIVIRDDQCLFMRSELRRAINLIARAFVTVVVIISLGTIDVTNAANQPGEGGGDGGGGGTPTAPPGNMCYLPSGAATSVGLSSLGGGVNEISIHFNFPPAGFGWTTRTRVTATGGDGSITFDQEMDSFPGAYYPGGQPGDARGDFPSDTDTSGGMTIDTTMIDPNGNTVDAEGMIYPPDPVTNTC